MTDKTKAPERRVTFGNETPETSDVVLCNYCGGSLHDVEQGVFWDQTRNHYCEPAKDKRIAELEALVTHMTPFAKMGNWAANNLFGHISFESAEIFDVAKDFGLIEPIPGGYDPDQHDDEYGGAEAGDPWYSLRNLRLPDPLERVSLADKEARATLAELKGTDQ